MSKIKKSVVLITGASRGLGRQLSLEIAKKGGKVVAVARNKSDLESLVSEIQNAGGEAFSLPADLTDLPSLSPMMKQAEQAFGPIDIVINNAGCVNFLPLESYSLQEMQNLFHLNTVSAMEITRLVLPSMLAKRKGHIVNVSSVSGKLGSPFGNIYVASKAALIMWTHAQRIELDQSGVSISLICPSYVEGVGAVVDLGLNTPKLIPKNSPKKVVSRIIEAIEKDQAEVMIVPGLFPARPLLALAQIFPTLQDHVLRWMGVTQVHRHFALKQAKTRAESSLKNSVAH